MCFLCVLYSLLFNFTCGSLLTEEDEETHTDCQDGAGTEGGQSVTFDLPQLTALTPETF